MGFSVFNLILWIVLGTVALTQGPKLLNLLGATVGALPKPVAIGLGVLLLLLLASSC